MREKVSKTLSMTYDITKKEFPKLTVFFIMPFFIVVTTFLFYGRSIDPMSALGFLSAIAQISATILSIFSAAFTFLLQRYSSKEITEHMSKGEFVASFLCFVMAILHSLIGMLTIKQNTFVDLSNIFEGFILVVPPLWWMVTAILMLAVFVWRLYVKELGVKYVRTSGR